MNALTAPRALSGEVDLGQALSALLRSYLDGAQSVVGELPGGPRGYQVVALAASSQCSNQAEIARQLGLDRTVVTHLVDDLERAGLVERQPDPVDRRARRVLLTDSGRHSLAAVVSQMAAVERGVLASLTDDEVAEFRALLAKSVLGAPITDNGDCSDGSDLPGC